MSLMLDDLDGPSVLMVGCEIDEIEHVISSSSIEDNNVEVLCQLRLVRLGKGTGAGRGTWHRGFGDEYIQTMLFS